MFALVRKLGPFVDVVRSISIRFAAAAIIACAFSSLAVAQTTATPQTADTQAGQIMGTLVDVNGNVIPGATVVLADPEPADRRSAETGENGFFKFDNVKPGVAYRLNISAMGFADSSSAITLDAGEVKILGSVPLALAVQQTTVQVTANSPEETVQVAMEQVKFEETQRVLGIIPNFYVSYEGEDTVPLTAGMKFGLALRASYDPATIGGVGLLAAMDQAADTPSYRQGMKGYSERFGATAANGFSDIMAGGAILPSLLHQDPRYFYQGSGTKKSRLRHAMLAPFICKGDNGLWQPNYSSMGGDLASGALANLYYPQSDRGAGLMLSAFAISTGTRIVSTVVQEFVLGRFTHRSIEAN
jgi:hypothetical protein